MTPDWITAIEKALFNSRIKSNIVNENFISAFRLSDNGILSYQG
jgi:hypothetical protein